MRKRVCFTLLVTFWLLLAVMSPVYSASQVQYRLKQKNSDSVLTGPARLY